MKTRSITATVIALAMMATVATAAEARIPAPPKDTIPGLPYAAVAYDVTFVKHATNPAKFTFAGVTGAAAKGTLTSTLTGQPQPPTPHFRFVTFHWTVDAGKHSFAATTTGTVDLNTGVVVMSGTVDSGWEQGKEVLEKGQLIDPATLTFAGDLIILDRDDSTPEF